MRVKEGGATGAIWFEALPRELCGELEKYCEVPMLAVLAEVPGFRITDEAVSGGFSWEYKSYPSRLRAARANLCWWAAGNGSLSVLKWARARQFEWDKFTCWEAAWGGHLAVLQWARQNGCEWDSHTCSEAALGGHLSVLQWLRENGCPWDEDTCASAARCGHLAMLQWARANGCPWDKYTCREAAREGHLSVLQWARENGCPCDEDCEEICRDVAARKLGRVAGK